MTTRIALAVATLLLPSAVWAQFRDIDDELRFRASNVEVTVRFHDNRVKPLGNQIRDLLTSALLHYTAVFGGPPRGPDGAPAVRLTVNVGSDRTGLGDTRPGIVSLLVSRETALGFYDWRLALLHETFHLWNTESFRHAGAGEQWFAEGTAEFYGAQVAARAGVLDQEGAVRAAGVVVEAYAQGAAGRPSLLQAGAPTTSAGRAIHHDGWTAALVLDRAIRVRSGNTRSLDDVMAWLYAHHDPGTRYGTVDLVRGFRESTGQDVTEFFARHVMGRLPMSPADTLGLGDAARAGGVATDSLLLYSLGVKRRP